ncbi:MAG: hypothetical protein IJC02_01360 [Lachnospiraceae bacterium]|nr:hypothetical protein [Lachnospiraceae bacterium]
MKKDDREILKEVQKNSQMAVKAIDTITEKTCDEIMRYELVKERRKYTDIYNRAEERLLQNKAEEYHASAIEDVILKGAINVNTALNCSSSKLAELMIQGRNRGITNMWKAMNHNESATETSLEIAKELIDFEEKCIEKLKHYL